MTSAQKKSLAKEWLLLTGFVLFGFTVLPAAIMGIGSGTLEGIEMGRFYSGLVYGSYKLNTWLIALSPYVLCQLIRSLVWAAQTLRSDSLKK